VPSQICQAISLTAPLEIKRVTQHRAENLMVLPPMENSIRDKLMLLKPTKRPMPMRTQSDEERAAFFKGLKEGLPGFLYSLRQFKIPTELESPRFGITHFHHPENFGSH